MGDQTFPRAAVRKIEKRETFPLIALNGVTDLRIYLNEVESEAIIRAHQLGATAEDIADALAITRQGVYYKLKALSGQMGATDEPPEPSTETGPQRR